MFKEEEGDSCAPVPALMIYGTVGDSATPGDGLVGFKAGSWWPIAGVTADQVTFLLPGLYNTGAHNLYPNKCRIHQGLEWAASLHCTTV